MEIYNKKELVEKWEQSGLLEGALKKEDVAQTLESSAAWIMDFVEKDDMKKVNTAASIVFPVVRRVLGQKDFTFEHTLLHMLKRSDADQPIIGYKHEVEFIPWSSVLTDTPHLAEELQLKACQQLEVAFKEKLNKYENLVINTIMTTFKEDGFEIGFRCS